jgi:hypothetical protein
MRLGLNLHVETVAVIIVNAQYSVDGSAIPVLV